MFGSTVIIFKKKFYFLKIIFNINKFKLFKNTKNINLK